MKLALISAGQTASHSYVLVQLPNPSASITLTIRSTRLSRSGWPCGRNDRCETFAAVKSMADRFGHAAAHAPHPMQAAASIARSASCLGTGIEFASGAEPARAEMNPPACTMRSKRAAIDHQIFDKRERSYAKRLDCDRRAVAKLSHVKLTHRARMIGSVWLAVDRERASAANTFAAIRVERDWFLSAFHQSFIEDVEHFEKRGVRRNVAHFVIDEFAWRFWVGLTPNS